MIHDTYSVSLFRLEHNNKGVLKLCKIFVEYQIKSSCLDAYKSWLAQCRLNDDQRVEVFESTMQPGLFVEIWETSHSLKTFKAMRQKSSSPWFLLNKWVEGGEEKIRMWEFQRIFPSPHSKG